MIINTNKRTDDEIETLEDWCGEADVKGSHYSGMTYEQGIRATLDWLFNDEPNPNEEEEEGE